MSTNQALPLFGEMAIFVKVVDTGSFSEAARQLGSTPSATSRGVARLEKALGLRLLERTTRKLRLSEAGREVHARCLDMVGAAQAVMAASLLQDAQPRGLVRISVPKAVPMAHWPARARGRPVRALPGAARPWQTEDRCQTGGQRGTDCAPRWPPRYR